jgi:hypothetical protein
LRAFAIRVAADVIRAQAGKYAIYWDRGLACFGVRV